MRNSLIGYFTSAMLAGGTFAAVHGHKERGGTRPWLIPRDACVGAIAYPLVFPIYPFVYIYTKGDVPCPFSRKQNLSGKPDRVGEHINVNETKPADQSGVNQ